MEQKFLPLLTDEQAKKYKDAIEESSDTPAGRVKRFARSMLWRYRPADLTEAQQTQIVNIYVKALAAFYEANSDYERKSIDLSAKVRQADADAKPEAAQAARAEAVKFTQPMTDLLKSVREQADKVLTAEQRDKVKQAAVEHARQMINQTITNVTLPLDALGLSEDQTRKVAELTAAAREALAQTVS